MIEVRAVALALVLLAAPAAAQTVSPAPESPASQAAKPVAKPPKPRTTPVLVAPGNAHSHSLVATPPPIANAPPMLPTEPKGTVTGLRLPRWAALRADEVNLRVGPGTRYPIKWQYRRRDLPVLILREVDLWRLIQDQDGEKGWVQHATLVPRRSFVVTGAEAVMRDAAADEAAAVARLKPDVVGRIRACEAGAAWCEVQVDEYRGWLRRDQFWGSDAGEAVGN